MRRSETWTKTWMYEFLPILPSHIGWLMMMALEVLVLIAKSAGVGIVSLCRAVVSLSIKTLAMLCGWIAGAVVCSFYLDILSLYIIFTLFALIFLNLGERKSGELSAYSVFNDGFEEILGTLNAQQFDREIRHLDQLPLDDDSSDVSQDDYKNDYYIPSDSDDELNEVAENARKESTKRSTFASSLQRRVVAQKVRAFSVNNQHNNTVTAC